MAESTFPTTLYAESLSQLLNTIEYHDTNYTPEQRCERLHHVYADTAAHFAHPSRMLGVSAGKMQAWVQCIVRMVVYGYPTLSPELLSDLCIYYTYTVILDDSFDGSDDAMATFSTDLVKGKPQKHTWWRLINEHFPDLLKRYGGFCSLNILRSTLDFFQGCWIEQHNFQGYRGSHAYPTYLRRMNGLGHCVGASLFPKEYLDERNHMTDIACVIALMESWEIYTNDLLSFYKEYDDTGDDSYLINNYRKCEGISVEQALQKLTDDVVACSNQLREVFKGRDDRVWANINGFMQGYVTWHLSDKRYRLSELAAELQASDEGKEVVVFWKQAQDVGHVEPEKWAFPSVKELMPKTNGFGSHA